MTTTIIAIAAISRERRALGKDNDLLWHLPGDLPRFKALTDGHPIIMGANTYASLPKKPLPNRTNIVLTRNANYTAEGALVMHSPEEALAAARAADGSEKVYVIGGAQVYAALLPYTDVLDLTIVDDEPDADVFFPDYSEFSKVHSEEAYEHEGLRYTYTQLSRPTT